jgi:hypothetical protein
MGTNNNNNNNNNNYEPSARFTLSAMDRLHRACCNG